jgi:Protein of unknown function (DUF3501)
VPTLSVDDLILDPEEYAAVRRDRRADAIALRRLRRVLVGDEITIEFENNETLHYQAQEMIYVERITDADQAAQELSVYARLLPTSQMLTATMLIEIVDQSVVRSELARLDGVHEAVTFQVGAAVTRAREIPPPEEGPSPHTVSVHFLAFDLSPEAIAALAAGEPARIAIEHPAYPWAATLGPATTALLAGDLRAGLQR